MDDSKAVSSPSWHKRTSRRDALALLASAGVAAPVLAQLPRNRPSPVKPALALVSRHLQWTDAANGIRVAKAAGFGAILWTVRRGAHVEPAQVATELPRIVAMTRDAGLATPMVITGIGDATSDGAEAILATLERLGIPLYRAGAPRYQYDAPIQPQFDDFRRKLEVLSRLNARHGTTAAFHTHAYADTIGGSGWDMLIAMQGLDPRYVGLNYDIGHVMAKGGAGWRESVRAAGPYLHSCSLKDFLWERQASVPAGQWPWRTRFVRPGDGMVDVAGFFRYLQEIGFQGPLETYFEYSVSAPGRAPVDLLGSDYRRWTLEVPQAAFVDVLHRDVGFYNSVWLQAATTPRPPSFSVKAGNPSA